MVIDLLLFPLFLCILYMAGAGTLRITHGRQNAYPSWFCFTAALFSIGFLSVLFNFFADVASPLFYAIIACLCVIGIMHSRRLNPRDFSEVLILGIMLAPFAANMPTGPDAGLYHLPHQLWIRDEKIVFGLANFNTRFGFGSFSEYILAPLWTGEQFKLLSYTAATYFLILLLFLARLARSSNAQAVALGALTMIALTINSKYFVTGYTSTDTPCGILFAITFFYGFSLLGKDSAVERKHLAIFFICALFSFFCKASGVTIFLWVLFVLIHLLRARRLTWNLLLRASILPAVLMLIWLAHSVILSGCLLYPIVSSCLNVPWAATAGAIDNANWVTAFARQPTAELQSLQGWSWISDWWLPYYWPFCLYQLATVMIAACLYRYFCREKLGSCRIALPALIFTVFCLMLWFIKSPTPRFGIGVFAILPAVVAMSVFGIRRLPSIRLPQRNAMLSTLGGILVTILAAKLVIADAAGGRGRTYAHFVMPTVEAAITQPYRGFGVRPVPPETNKFCWLAKYCSPDYKTDDTIREKYGYKYFHE